jgi:cholesterol transport system auxiliary component
VKTLLGIARFATRTSTLLLLLAAAAGSTGCLSKPALNKRTFAFGTPPATATNRFNNHQILGIRKLQIAAPFDGRSLVYRTGEFSYERDPYAEFLDAPGEDLLPAMSEWLCRSGNFEAVVAAGSALKPGLLVEINVSQLYGDFRQPKQPAAIFTVQFVFLEATNGIPGKAIFQTEYSRSVPLNAPTAFALMAGWNEALAKITAEVSSDLRSLRTGQHPD